MKLFKTTDIKTVKYRQDILRFQLAIASKCPFKQINKINF